MNSPKNKSLLFWIILIAFIVEVLMLTFLRNAFGNFISSFIFFSASMAVGVVGIKAAFHLPPTSPGTKAVSSLNKKIVSIIAGLLVVISFFIFKNLFDNYIISVNQSDIIPQIQILVQRFLNNEISYTTISVWGYDLFPTYMPFQWIPFSMAEILNFDYRWIASLIFILSFLYLVRLILIRELSLEKNLCLLIAFIFPVLSIYYAEPSIYVVSVENLIVGYYLFFCFSLYSGNLLKIGCAILICLLSRYSLVLWLPLFFFILFITGERKKLKFIITIVGAGILLLYIIPFLLHDSSIFLNSYFYHTKAALAEWSGQSWQQPGDKPFQLFRGLGFAGVFYDITEGTIIEKLTAYRILHFILSAATFFILAFIFYRNRNKIDATLFTLASLKIYLVIFYHFIQIPYDYLFLVPVYITIPLLFYSATR